LPVCQNEQQRRKRWPRHADDVEREGSYGGPREQDVDLEITDTAARRTLVGLASWVQGEKEETQRSERTTKEMALVHERMSKVGGTNEFSIVLGDRFVVKADRPTASTSTAEERRGQPGLAKLEGMKDVGVQK